MDKPLFHSYLIEDRSYVSFIKRGIHNLIKPVFNELRTGEIDIVISEITSNLIKYAQRGELLYRLSEEQGEPVFEVICIDNGPGIRDVVHSSKDGISSRNSLGQGIGSINRLSNAAQLYSLPDWGTIVYSRFYNSTNYEPPRQQVLVRCINVAKPGEKVSGDGICVRQLRDRTMVLVGDGLGHGLHAHDAVEKAIQAFKLSTSPDPAVIIRELNDFVKKTRGLVATVAVLDHHAREWHLCGVGNIYTRLQKGLEHRNYVCNNGIIGLNIPNRLESASYSMEKLQQLVLCSDGIKIKWDVIRYPGILKYDPMILAAALYKDHARRTDDMTILIAKVI